MDSTRVDSSKQAIRGGSDRRKVIERQTNRENGWPVFTHRLATHRAIDRVPTLNAGLKLHLAAAAWHTTRPCRSGATSDGTTTAGVAVVIVSARGHATAITGLVRSPRSGAVASQMHPPLALASPTVRPRSSLLTRAQLRWRLRSSSRKSSCPVPVARHQQASAAGAPDCRHSTAEAEAEASAAAAHRRASRRHRRES